MVNSANMPGERGEKGGTAWVLPTSEGNIFQLIDTSSQNFQIFVKTVFFLALYALETSIWHLYQESFLSFNSEISNTFLTFLTYFRCRFLCGALKRWFPG